MELPRIICIVDLLQTKGSHLFLPHPHLHLISSVKSLDITLTYIQCMILTFSIHEAVFTCRCFN